MEFSLPLLLLSSEFGPIRRPQPPPLLPLSLSPSEISLIKPPTGKGEAWLVGEGGVVRNSPTQEQILRFGITPFGDTLVESLVWRASPVSSPHFTVRRWADCQGGRSREEEEEVDI